MRPPHWIAAGLLAAVAIGYAAIPAAADVHGTVHCQGLAVVEHAKRTFQVRSDQHKAVIPREGSVNWVGAVTPVTHHHSGKVWVDLGLFTIPLGHWKSANAGNVATKTGKIKLPAALKWVPPGVYHVRGVHKGDEGSCSGKVDLEFEGDVTGSPVGIATIIGTVLAGLGLISAGKVRP